MASAIVDAFDKRRRDHPDRPLIYLPASQSARSARSIGESAERVASILNAASIERDRLIVSAVGNAPMAFAVFLACRVRGVALLALDGAATDVEIAGLAQQFDAAAVIVPPERDGAGVSIEGEAVLTVPAHQQRGLTYPGTALLKLTSGSSGRPRATLTPESALISDGTRLATVMDIRPSDVQLAAVPLAHAYGLGNLVMPLLLQGTAICLRDTFVPQRVPDDARQFGARHLPGAPFMFEHLVTHPPPAGWPPTLTHLLSAGAPLDPKIAERFRAAFGLTLRQLYGTSETGGIAFDEGEHSLGEAFCGRPMPGVEITLLESPDYAPAGRVHVRSGAVSTGYAGEDGADSFVSDGFLTGDLGTIDADGRLTLRGRVSSFVNIAGRKVQPEEVERVLRAFAGVIDVRVVGMEDRQRGERLVACLVVSGTPPTVLELRSFCGRQLAAHKIPRAFVFLESIPISARGKTDHERLRAVVERELAADGML